MLGVLPVVFSLINMQAVEGIQGVEGHSGC